MFDRHHTDDGLVLHFHSQSEHACVVIELVVSDHCAKVHERLPTIGQDHHEPGPDVEIVSGRNVVLESELGGGWIEVLNILYIQEALRIGKFMDVIGIDLRYQHAHPRIDRRLSLHSEYALEGVDILVVISEFEAC